MQCPQCQRENPTHANFCLHCGTRLATVCPQCQQVLPPDAGFDTADLQEAKALLDELA